MIRAREVRLIDETGANVGVVATSDALERAAAAGVDLVEISPDANPPVCKIMDYGKFKYQEQKKAAEARKNQKVVELKEIKMRPSIDDHDYDVKMRSMRRFFEEGDKVKVTLRFRGREMAHQEYGFRVVEKFINEVERYGHPDAPPKKLGKGLTVMLSPLPRAKRAKNPRETDSGIPPSASHDPAPEEDSHDDPSANGE